MVSAFEVYLVLQLDSILNVLTALAILLSLALAGLTTMWLINNGDGVYDNYGRERGEKYTAAHNDYWNKVRKFIVRLSVPAVLCVLLATFLPSSKTAAAMIIVPALTSKDVVQPLTDEAKDLYALAKGALKKVIEQAPKPEAKEAN